MDIRDKLRQEARPFLGADEVIQAVFVAFVQGRSPSPTWRHLDQQAPSRSRRLWLAQPEADPELYAPIHSVRSYR